MSSTPKSGSAGSKAKPNTAKMAKSNSTPPQAAAKPAKATESQQESKSASKGKPQMDAKQATVFIKRRRTHQTVNQLEYQARREAERQRARQIRQERLKDRVVRAEHIVARARRNLFAEKKHTKRTKLGAVKVKADSVKVPENVLLVVVRIKAPQLGTPRAVADDLQFLRLGPQNSASLVPSTPAYRNALARVQSYVTYGVPSLKTVTDLFFKHGRMTTQQQTQSLTNALVQQKLGKYDVVCIEDVIHELMTLGPHLSKCLKAFRYFKLKSPASGWAESTAHFTAGGNAGYRGDDINDLLKTMM